MTVAAFAARARDLAAAAVRFPIVAAIRGYQLVISPWTMSSCRYYPSCSQYALEAVQGHGVLRGGWLAARRLGRCHPWSAGGVDHVPPSSSSVSPAPVLEPHPFEPTGLPRETRARSLT
jgi:putative membrane protein insertion efficiency factor